MCPWRLSFLCWDQAHCALPVHWSSWHRRLPALVMIGSLQDGQLISVVIITPRGFKDPFKRPQGQLDLYLLHGLSLKNTTRISFRFSPLLSRNGPIPFLYYRMFTHVVPKSPCWKCCPFSEIPLVLYWHLGCKCCWDALFNDQNILYSFHIEWHRCLF